MPALIARIISLWISLQSQYLQSSNWDNVLPLNVPSYTRMANQTTYAQMGTQINLMPRCCLDFKVPAEKALNATVILLWTSDIAKHDQANVLSHNEAMHFFRENFACIIIGKLSTSFSMYYAIRKPIWIQTPKFFKPSTCFLVMSSKLITLNMLGDWTKNGVKQIRDTDFSGGIG